MKYLLDVNALVAWRHQRSPQHEVFHEWISRVGAKNVATCAHAELGFIRVSMQVFRYSLPEAQGALEKMKLQAGRFVEKAPSPRLAGWAVTPKQTTDAYLCQLAETEGMRLATFDAGISGAVLIR